MTTKHERAIANACKTVDLRAELIAWATGLGFIVETTWCTQIIAQTRVGMLTIAIFHGDADWIPCRFDDIAKATAELGAHTGPPGHRKGPRLNGFSGKWNWHWFEHAPHGSYNNPTKAVVTAALRRMLTTFKSEVEALLDARGQVTVSLADPELNEYP